MDMCRCYILLDNLKAIACVIYYWKRLRCQAHLNAWCDISSFVFTPDTQTSVKFRLFAIPFQCANTCDGYVCLLNTSPQLTDYCLCDLPMGMIALITHAAAN